MPGSGDLPTASPVEAAARLRHVAELRGRARRATLLPSFSLLTGLGAVLVAHGVVVAIWPHDRLAWLAWLAAVVIARPALRAGSADAPLAAARLWVACAAATLAGMVIGEAVGVAPLLNAIGAALALRAALARMPAVALAIVAAVAAIDVAGLPTAGVEIVAGAALVAAGLVFRAREGRAA
ncbi:MAG TPA: hypothetical protein VH418_13545 [Solirubrobacteraceae bacterium]|jgi:hypothetical protein